MSALRKIDNGDHAYLQPGDFHFSIGPDCIHTLLGSCVSITLWHPRFRIGGMCHFMLPGRGGAAADVLDGRYADEALQMFLAEIRRYGTRPAEYQAKLFGGGNMFQIPGMQRVVDVGNRNIEAARRLLQENGFDLMAENVGGNGHRRIFFNLRDGNVWVRHEKLSAFPFGGL